MYCVGGFLPFSEIFPLPCHNVGEIPTVFLRKKSQIFSAQPVPLLPQAQWLVAVKTPLLLFLLFISAICLQTAYSLRQGLGLITFVHLSLHLVPGPGLHTSVFSIQQYVLNQKTPLDPGDPEPMSRCVEAQLLSKGSQSPDRYLCITQPSKALCRVERGWWAQRGRVS